MKLIEIMLICRQRGSMLSTAQFSAGTDSIQSLWYC